MAGFVLDIGYFFSKRRVNGGAPGQAAQNRFIPRTFGSITPGLNSHCAKSQPQVSRKDHEDRRNWRRGCPGLQSGADLTWGQLGGKLDRELHAAFLMTKAIVPEMIFRSYGRLIYLSTVSRRPRDGMITLGTAKAALDQFVRFIALELAPHGITANLVAPATVQATQQLTHEEMDQLGAATPMGRLVRPDDVAATIAFLASDDAGATTGHCIPVNGGASMD